MIDDGANGPGGLCRGAASRAARLRPATRPSRRSRPLRSLLVKAATGLGAGSCPNRAPPPSRTKQRQRSGQDMRTYSIAAQNIIAQWRWSWWRLEGCSGHVCVTLATLVMRVPVGNAVPARCRSTSYRPRELLPAGPLRRSNGGPTRRASRRSRGRRSQRRRRRTTATDTDPLHLQRRARTISQGASTFGPRMAMIGTTLQHYRILAKLGEAEWARSTREDTKLQRRVALKLLPPDMAPTRSACSVSSARHGPSRPSTTQRRHDIQRRGDRRRSVPDDGTGRGKTLAELIPEEGLPLEDLLKLAVPLVDAVRPRTSTGSFIAI